MIPLAGAIPQGHERAQPAAIHACARQVDVNALNAGQEFPQPRAERAAIRGIELGDLAYA
jgi:hypothetical protein